MNVFVLGHTQQARPNQSSYLSWLWLDGPPLIYVTHAKSIIKIVHSTTLNVSV